MSETDLHKLAIDRFFLVAFGRDRRMHDACEQSAYLDLDTGDISFVYANDEEGRIHYGVSPAENQSARQRIHSGGDRYLEVPGIDHGNHETILQEFLETDWAEDSEQLTAARKAYQGSVTGWIGALDCEPQAVQAYNRFKEARVRELALEFLSEHGIDPVWR